VQSLHLERTEQRLAPGVVSTVALAAHWRGAPQGMPFGTSELAKSVADCAGFKWGEFDALLSRTRTSAPVFASQNLLLPVVKA
jgi:hypothetical protein